MHSEIKNYCYKSLNPVFFIMAIGNLSWRIILSILRRTIPHYRVMMMPKKIVTLRRLILKNKILIPSIQANLYKCSGSLMLTNGSLDFEGAPDWFTDFEDQEVANSLHRWGWLLYGLTEENQFSLSREEGLSLIRSWLQCCLHLKRFKNDAYSNSERIANASIFLLTTGDKTVPKDIHTAFQYMGLLVAKNLEYYEADMTGNHAFNNARGLLFSGIVCGLPNAVELSYEIFKERLPKLVTIDGFLREGSSHYHFLFTRWLLEVQWILSNTRNKEIEDFIKSYSKKLVEKCWFFLVKNSKTKQWSIPFVGDISPDYSPDWLISVPWSLLALNVFKPVNISLYEGKKGWASLFGMSNGCDDAIDLESQTYPDSYWHRIEHNKFTFFVHAESSNGKLRSDHRHIDLGSFVLYYAGQPVIVDCGRSDYTQSKVSNYGRSAASHNTLFVNKLPPEVDGPSWLQPAYKRLDVITNLLELDSSTIFTIKHNGFDRISNLKVLHERKFKFISNDLEIEDIFRGDKACDLRLCFHYIPKFGVPKEMNFDIVLDNIDATFYVDKRLRSRALTGQKEDPIGGLFSTEYGVAYQCTTLNIEGVIELPATIKNRLSFDL
jgi:hypothetical protein